MRQRTPVPLRHVTIAAVGLGARRQSNRMEPEWVGGNCLVTMADKHHTSPSPAVQYQTPAELAQDASKSHDERLRLLEEWEDDIRGQLVASEEGMTGPQGVSLADVLAAKSELPIDTPPRPSDAKA